MVEAPKNDEAIKSVLVDCARAIHAGKSLASTLGVSEAYIERVEKRAHELYIAERYDDVETLCRGVLAIDPGRFYPNLLLGDVLTREGDKATEGLELLQKAHEIEPASELSRFTLGQALARGGVMEEAREILSGIAEESDYYKPSTAILERLEQVEAATQ